MIPVTASPPEGIDALHARRKSLDADYLRRRAHYPKGVLSKRLARKFEHEAAPIRRALTDVHAAISRILKAQRDAEQPPKEAAPVVIAPSELIKVAPSLEAVAEQRRRDLELMRAEFRRRDTEDPGWFHRQTIAARRRLRPVSIPLHAMASRTRRSPRTTSTSTTASSTSSGSDGPSADSDPPASRGERATPPENLEAGLVDLIDALTDVWAMPAGAAP